MRKAFALAFASIMALGVMRGGPADAAALCQSSMIHAGAPYLNLNQGDTSTVRVTGYKPTLRSKSSPAPGIVLHVTAGDSLTVSRTATGTQSTTVTLPANFVGNVVIDPTPSPTPIPTASPVATTAPSPIVRPGGPDDKLTATIKDERYASFSASPAPTSSPSAGGDDAQPPAIDYTVKGEYPGDTTLVVVQGAECVAIAVHVRPGVSDKSRFLTTAGIGTSMVPSYTIGTVTAPAPGTPNGTATRVLKTENSGHGVSIPLLFNYRLSDNARYNLYGTVGVFTNPGSGGLVYGVSLGKEQFLWTVGMHSNTVNEFAPGLHNNDIVPSGVSTTVTRRVTSAFFALTVPITFVSQLLGSLTGGSTGSGSGSSTTSGSSTPSSKN
jgi:hypothetical protein